MLHLNMVKNRQQHQLLCIQNKFGGKIHSLWSTPSVEHSTCNLWICKYNIICEQSKILKQIRDLFTHNIFSTNCMLFPHVWLEVEADCDLLCNILRIYFLELYMKGILFRNGSFTWLDLLKKKGEKGKNRSYSVTILQLSIIFFFFRFLSRIWRMWYILCDLKCVAAGLMHPGAAT